MADLISQTEQGRVTIVSLDVASVDTANVLDLDKALTQLITADTCRIVLDLSKLGFISSAGLRSLLQAAKAARQHGGDLRLANATPTVKRVFILVGMQDIFRLFDDLPSAIASYG